MAAVALIDVFRDAGRRRQYLDIAIILGLAVATVWVLVAYGDIIMQ